jgi:hypothetical protein
MTLHDKLKGIIESQLASTQDGGNKPEVLAYVLEQEVTFIANHFGAFVKHHTEHDDIDELFKIWLEKHYGDLSATYSS